MSFEFRFAAASSAGVRKHNEDNYVAHPLVCAVTDGMGGHSAGDVASDIVAATLNELASMAALDPDDLLIALRRAHQQLVGRNDKAVGANRMGTTVSGIALLGVGHDACAVFNVGDSRTYRRRDGVLQQMTTDHSVVQELLDSGAITQSEASGHPERNVITRVMGGAADLEIDFWLQQLAHNDRFLVCTDGVTTALDDREISEILSADDAHSAANRLVDRAIQAGSRDNATAVVVDVLARTTNAGTADDDTARRTESDDTQPRSIAAASTAQETIEAIAAVPFDLSHLKRGSEACD